MILRRSVPILASTLTLASAAYAAPFSHNPPGQLPPDSGAGRVDATIYAPKMRFPIETGPAFANSQVYGRGGGSGPGGGQCDAENFTYPWHDNYCESRSWDMPLCPSGTGHQGQDIRAATCEKAVHWVVASDDGTITNVGSYSVYVTAPDGTRYDYLHMSDVAVKEGDEVKRGQRIGKVSNEFGGTPTTVHLHFNIKQNIAGIGVVFVPPYTSLINAYEDLLGLRPTAPPPRPPPPLPLPTPVTPDEPAAERVSAPIVAPPAPDESGCASARGTLPPVGFVGIGLAMGVVLRRRRSR